MNDAVIEQAGKPGEIFNAPRTQFVARFMGGHNIVEADGQAYALRTDRTRLVSGQAGVLAQVSNVEFLGRSVDISLDCNGTELVASLGDSEFHAQPVAAGESVTVQWDKSDLHALNG